MDSHGGGKEQFNLMKACVRATYLRRGGLLRHSAGNRVATGPNNCTLGVGVACHEVTDVKGSNKSIRSAGLLHASRRCGEGFEAAVKTRQYRHILYNGRGGIF